MLRTTLLATIAAIVLPSVTVLATSSWANTGEDLKTGPVADFDVIHCRLPQAASVDRPIAQSGKVRPAAATPVAALPVSAIRKQAHRARDRDILLAAPVSYVRCAKSPG